MTKPEIMEGMGFIPHSNQDGSPAWIYRCEDRFVSVDDKFVPEALAGNPAEEELNRILTPLRGLFRDENCD